MSCQSGKCLELAKKWSKLLCPIVTVVVILSFLVIFFSEQLGVMADWFKDRQPMSIVVYLVIYTVLICLCAPKLHAVVIAGYCFGFPIGWAIGTLGVFFSVCLILGAKRISNSAVCARRSSTDGDTDGDSGKVVPQSRIQMWLLANYDLLRVYSDMMVEKPFQACVMAQLTVLPYWAKTYGIIILDAPVVPMFAAILLVQGFYGGIQAYMGAIAESIVDELQGNGQSDVLDKVVLAIGISATLVAFFLIRRSVNIHIRDSQRRSQAQEQAAEELALKLQQGDMVIVLETFLGDDDEKTKRYLRPGRCGIIHRIDDEGDANIDFFEEGQSGTTFRQWVHKPNFRFLAIQAANAVNAEGEVEASQDATGDTGASTNDKATDKPVTGKSEVEKSGNAIGKPDVEANGNGDV